MIHWGILGAGNIAQRFVEGLAQEKEACLYAVAGRNAEKLEKFRTYAAYQKAYLNYEALICDERIDAVYLSLPTQMHYEWAMKALQHNKAVLCEKPATINREQIARLCETSEKNHVFFMEAMKSRFIPMYQYIKMLLENRCIGNIKSVDVGFCTDVEESRRHNLYDPLGGGCLLDTGIYGIAFLLDFLGKEYRVENVDYTTAKEVLSYVKAELAFGDAHATLRCAFDRDWAREGIIEGDLGILRMDNFYRPQRLTIQYFSGVKIEKELPYDFNDFYSEIAEANRCIVRGETQSMLMSHADSIRCAEMTETIQQFIKQGKAKRES